MSASLSIQETTQAMHKVYDGTDGAPCLRQYAYCYVERFYDFIVVVDGKSFKALRIVLCQRSEYFNTLTQASMNEQYAKQVELKDMEASTFEVILVFMFTNKLEVNCENVHKLLMAANYLVIDEVKEYCIQFLESVMTVKNYFTIRQMAEVCQLTKLMKISDTFFIENLMEICDSAHFKQLTKNEVVTLVVAAVKNQVCHDKLFKAIVWWVEYAPDERTSLFGELFKMIDLTKMSPAFIQHTVSTEELMKKEVEQVWKILQMIPVKNAFGNGKADKTRVSVIGGEMTGKEVSIFDVKLKKIVQIHNIEFKHMNASAVEIDDGAIMCVAGGKYNAGSNNVHVVAITDEGLKCKQINPMNEKRRNHQALRSGDKIYVSGGCNGRAVRVNEIYSIQRNEWNIIPDWETSRSAHGMVLYNGCLICVGGYCGSTRLNSVECFDPDDGKVTTITPMNCARDSSAVVVIDNDIYATGGHDGKKYLDSVEKYSDGKWSFVAPMNKARWRHAACVVNNRILVVGGYGGDGAERTVEIYDPMFDTWSILCRLEKEYSDHSLVVI